MLAGGVRKQAHHWWRRKHEASHAPNPARAPYTSYTRNILVSKLNTKNVTPTSRCLHAWWDKLLLAHQCHPKLTLLACMLSLLACLVVTPNSNSTGMLGVSVRKAHHWWRRKHEAAWDEKHELLTLSDTSSILVLNLLICKFVTLSICNFVNLLICKFVTL